ncbi:MAG: AhpC/TSA family protein [Flavobacteriales bacterium]|nr:AhpC/TSA family protein [Flavobacteriales bacterium]
MRVFQFIIVSTVLFLAACQGELEYSLKGKFKNAEGKSLYIEKAGVQGFQTIATAVLDSDGEFLFTFPVRDAGYYRIRVGSDQSIILIIDKGESVLVNGDATNLGQNYTVEGSKNSVLYKEFFSSYQKNMVSIDSLKQMYTVIMQTTRDAIQIRQIQEQFGELSSAQSTFSKNFIDAHINDFVVLSVVESLEPEPNMEYYKKVESSMSKNFPNSVLAQNFVKKVSDLNRIAIGSIPPEIQMSDPNGNIVALSSLKGKVVLVDFWASWCRPCRMESPNLVRLYNQFNSSGFEIYSVSLDKNKNSWLQAIQQDQLNWIHVSELAYWNTSVVKTYGFSGIPFTVLLDRDGKIIGKNLRGAQLAQKVQEVLS